MEKIIIDVREPEEFSGSHVTGAVNIPLSLLSGSDIVRNLDKGAEIIVYCASGGRSGIAESILKGYGFTDVVNGVNKAGVEKLLRS